MLLRPLPRPAPLRPPARPERRPPPPQKKTKKTNTERQRSSPHLPAKNPRVPPTAFTGVGAASESALRRALVPRGPAAASLPSSVVTCCALMPPSAPGGTSVLATESAAVGAIEAQTLAAASGEAYWCGLARLVSAAAKSAQRATPQKTSSAFLGRRRCSSGATACTRPQPGPSARSRPSPPDCAHHSCRGRHPLIAPDDDRRRRRRAPGCALSARECPSFCCPPTTLLSLHTCTITQRPRRTKRRLDRT